MHREHIRHARFACAIALCAAAAWLAVGCTSLDDFAAPSCNYGVTPLTTTFPGPGGTATLKVQAAGVCAWDVKNDFNWIVVPATGGNGAGTLQFSAAANTSPAPRTGFITVAGQHITVSQAAGPPL